MNDFNSINYEDILQRIQDTMVNYYDFDGIKPLRSNPKIKSMCYKNKKYSNNTGMIIIGKYGGNDVVDIGTNSGHIKSFILEDNNEIINISNWLKENYDKVLNGVLSIVANCNE